MLNLDIVYTFSIQVLLDSLETLFYTFITTNQKEKPMAYAHTNSKGTTYYLHSNGRMFFFSKEVKEMALSMLCPPATTLWR
jgi:hypothetical protein